MRGWKPFLVSLAVTLAPGIAFAQATLTGVVRDTSGAVMPGVTVEAVSPVLIEKVRTASTDSAGRYQIFRVANTRTLVNVDLYNLFNANPVISENATYGAWRAGVGRAPNAVLQARFFKIGAQFDF